MFWVLVTVSVVIWLLWRLLGKGSPLDKLPGLPAHPIFVQHFQFMRHMSKSYGNRFVMRIFSKRVLYLTHPNDIEVVLKHSRNITKSKPYSFLKDVIGDGIFVSKGYSWHRGRKLLQPAFHLDALKHFAVIFAESSKDLLKKIELTQGKDVDLVPALRDFTIGTTCETAMGTKLDVDKSVEAKLYRKSIKEFNEQLMYRITRFWLHPDLMYKISSAGRRMKNTVRNLQLFCDKVIMERKKKSGPIEEVDGKKRRLAMLDLMLAAESRGEVDQVMIRDQVNSIMAAGVDTTAVTLSFCLSILAHNVDIQKKIYDECQEVLGDTERQLTFEDLPKLNYVDAVLKETMRIFSTVPYIGREITEDMLLGDLKVTKGQEIGILLYDLHRREDFHPEPETFKPERFLDSSKIHRFAFIPFSAGPRICIGQKYAMTIMKIVLLEICRHFTILPKHKGLLPEPVTGFLLRANEPMYVKFNKRIK